MNIEQWIHQMEEAYRAIGVMFSPDKKTLLLSEVSENMTESQKEAGAEAIEAITRFFFKKASRGETFGSLSRIKEKFGRSLEENYGLSSGPFIDMAKTYWTYKIEVQDLFPDHHNITLSQVLSGVEFNIAGGFFPTPGPAMLPLALRKYSQRLMLQEYAPDIDIERFQSENPILKVEEDREGKRGCLGKIVITREENPLEIKGFAHIKPAPAWGPLRCFAKCPGSSLRTCTLAQGHSGPHVAHGGFFKLHVSAVWAESPEQFFTDYRVE